jgi:epoxyqueuosine reductase QueG
MELETMNCPTRVRDFVVGIDYDSIEEDKGHLTIRRTVTITELIEEIKEIILIGSRYPQFPPEANPTVPYAWDLDNQEDGDCYHEVLNELEKDNRKEVT